MNEEHPRIWSALREVEFRQGFVDAGPTNAPTVVMLHGTGAHWETFARNLGPYGDRYWTIAFDMVGNGFSGRPDHDYEIPQYVEHTREVMHVLGVERAHQLGTSLGSWVAAAIALRHPARVMTPDDVVDVDGVLAAWRIRNDAEVVILRPDRSVAALCDRGLFASATDDLRSLLS